MKGFWGVWSYVKGLMLIAGHIAAPLRYFFGREHIVGPNMITQLHKTAPERRTLRCRSAHVKCTLNMFQSFDVSPGL